MENVIFIKGKNPELSRFEIESYLQAREVMYEILDDTDEFAVFALDVVDLERMMGSLGGTLKIARVMAEESGRVADILGRIDIEKLTKKDKFAFGASVYAGKDSAEIYEVVSKHFKSRFKRMGVKANFFKASHTKPQLTNAEVMNKDLLNESAEIIICFGKKYYIGKTSYLHNPFEFQKRDVGRPVQRTIYSISPRLSNILINLSGAKRDDRLLDPFCGIGTILQEAALNKMEIAGTDVGEECIAACIKNLIWLSKEYGLSLTGLNEKIFLGDARKLSDYFGENSIDAIATEPYLGPPLKKKSTEDEAKKIISDLRGIYEESLREMFKVLKPKKRAAIVSPRIKMTESKSIGLEFASIASATGFAVISSFIDAESWHKTIREIFVIEKP